MNTKLLTKVSSTILLLAIVCVLSFVLENQNVSAYSFDGHKWMVQSVPYYINPANPYSPADVTISSVKSAADAWKNDGQANVQYVYMGTTNKTSFVLDGQNTFFLRSLNPECAACVGWTYYWWDGTGKLVDFDAALNTNYLWYSQALGGCSGGVYMEDVGTHELGHGLGMGHSSVGTATMRTATSYCSTEQLTLDPDDIAGIQALYGRAGSTTPPPAPLPPPPPPPVLLPPPPPPPSTPDTTAPTVVITAPVNGSTVPSGNVAIAATASDNVGVSKVEFYVDGKLKATDSSVPYSTKWNTRKEASGQHTITARAFDAAGNTSTSTVTVNR